MTKQNFNKITIIVIKLLYINLNLNNFTNQNFSIFLNEIIKKREEKNISRFKNFDSTFCKIRFHNECL